MNELEQRNMGFRNFINGHRFKKAVETVVDDRLYYYQWLKDYLSSWNIDSPLLKSGESKFNYKISYIFKCMMLDGFFKEVGNTSVVYFIRNEYTGLLKIGKTNNLIKRIREIKGNFLFLGLEQQKLSIEAISYCPFGINNGIVETYYHNMFKKHRKNGEWFDVDYDLLSCSLNTDYIINGVLATVEDTGDFPYKIVPIELQENNIEYLNNIIHKYLSEEIRKYFYAMNSNNIFELIHKKNEVKSVSSKDVYKYIMTLKDDSETILESKIIRNLNNILDFSRA